ncbi:MAG: hypothetical protein SNJ52_03030 [Verrucomicrobiia bacterium]
MVENKAARNDQIQRLKLELDHARHSLATAMQQTKAAADLRTRISASVRRNPLGWGLGLLFVIAATLLFFRAQWARRASSGGGRQSELGDEIGSDQQSGLSGSTAKRSPWPKTCQKASLAAMRSLLPIAIKTLLTGPFGKKLVKSIISGISRS